MIPYWDIQGYCKSYTQSKIKKYQRNSSIFTQWIKPRLPYDYHLIIIELGEEFEGQFECLGENTTMLS